MNFVDTQVSWRWPEVWLGCRSPCLTAKSHKKGQFCLCFLNFIYTHTRVCVYLKTAWFLHFICGRSITTLFFFQVVPLNRGSLNTSNFFCLFLIVFCMLESWDYKIIVVTVFEGGGTW